MALKTGDLIPAPKFEFIPEALKQHTNWLLWKAKPIKDKPIEATKVPVTINGKEFFGWTNPKNLYSFNQVETAYKSGDFDGIGFVLVETDFICIDLDNNSSTKNISDELKDLISYGYSELSPSGNGYHIWIKGKKPEGMGKIGYTSSGEKLEVFGGSGWLTVTGETEWPVSLPEPIWNQSLVNDLFRFYFKDRTRKKRTTKIIERDSSSFADLEIIKEEMFNSRNGHKIRELWNGNTSMHGGDHSVADLALCGYLATYTQGDFSKIDILFRQSGLYRSKWDEQRGETTYGNLTISKAVEGRSVESYTNTKEHVPDQHPGEIRKGKEIGDEKEIKHDLNYMNDELMEIFFEHNKKHEELNQAFVEQIELQHKIFGDHLNKLKHDITKTIKSSIKESHKRQQEDVDSVDSKNTEYTEIIIFMNKFVEQQEQLIEFNKLLIKRVDQQLLKRLDEQQEYIIKVLEQRNKQLATVLKENLKVINMLPSNSKPDRKGFLARVFGR
jgi:primase-polymerase (primpol)-like protein